MPTGYLNQVTVGSKSFRQTETDGSVSARVQHPMNQVDLKRSHHSAIYLRNIYFSSVANVQMLWRYSEPRAQSPRSQCL